MSGPQPLQRPKFNPPSGRLAPPFIPTAKRSRPRRPLAALAPTLPLSPPVPALHPFRSPSPRIGDASAPAGAFPSVPPEAADPEANVAFAG